MLDVRIDHRWKRGGFHLDTSFQTGSRCLAISGPSGVGKSSILSCIAGLVRPDRGHIRVGEHVLFNATTWVPPHLRRIGLVLQEPRLFPLHDVRANLLFGSRPGRFQLDAVTEQLEIAHLLERRPRNLSGGEQQRVALGRALLSNPRLLLADEPLSALDEPQRDRLLQVLLELREQVPIVIATHSEHVIDVLAEDRLVLRGSGAASPTAPIAS